MSNYKSVQYESGLYEFYLEHLVLGVKHGMVEDIFISSSPV
jgi:hypothetical protein